MLVFCSTVLIFTLIGTLFAPSAAQIGTARSMATIPAHEFELAGFGLFLGLLSAIGCGGRKGLPLVILTPLLTLLLDLDHLSAFIGFAQTIRPAHSFVFIPVVLALTAITIKRLDVDLVVLSATLGHLGIDTGLFAPLSPIEFNYVSLDPYRTPFLIGAVIAAVVAGIVFRRNIVQDPTDYGASISN